MSRDYSALFSTDGLASLSYFSSDSHRLDMCFSMLDRLITPEKLVPNYPTLSNYDVNCYASVRAMMVDAKYFIQDVFFDFARHNIAFRLPRFVEFDVVNMFSSRVNFLYPQAEKDRDIYLTTAFYQNLLAYAKTNKEAIDFTSSQRRAYDNRQRLQFSAYLDRETGFANDKNIVDFHAIPFIFHKSNPYKKFLYELRVMLSYLAIHPVCGRIECFSLYDLYTFLIEENNVFFNEQFKDKKNKINLFFDIMSEMDYEADFYFFPIYRRRDNALYNIFPSVATLLTRTVFSVLTKFVSYDTYNFISDNDSYFNMNGSPITEDVSGYDTDFLMFLKKQWLDYFSIDSLFFLREKETLSVKHKYLEGFPLLFLVNILAQLAFDPEIIRYNNDDFCMQPNFFNLISKSLTEWTNK